MSKTLTAKSLLALTATGALVAMTPGVVAFASPTCSAGGTLISSGVCELKFTEPGSHTFNQTQTITKIDALIVGAGGAGDPIVGNSAYSGGGGDVKLVSIMTTGVAATIVVGAGSTGTDSAANDSSVTQAGTTTTAAGGHSPSNSGWGGASGNGNNGYSNWGNFPIGNANTFGIGYGGGGGAGAAATNELGGTGLVVNALPGASNTLFADDTTCYGGGGSGGGYATGGNNQFSAFSSTSVCGGGAVTLVLNGTTFTSYSMITPRANSGSGGAKYFNMVFSNTNIVSQPGADGIVIVRYEDSAAVESTDLANTGSTGLVETFAAGFALLGLGVGALAVRRRRS